MMTKSNLTEHQVPAQGCCAVACRLKRRHFTEQAPYTGTGCRQAAAHERRFMRRSQSDVSGQDDGEEYP